MCALTASGILSVCERALSQSPTQRALTLLAANCTEATPADLGRLSIGARDAMLMALREQAFGPQMTGQVGCPQCAQLLELNFSVADISAVSCDERSEHFTLTHGDFEVQFRLPNSLDLESLADDEVDSNGQLLLRRCVLAVRRAGNQATADDLPPEVISDVSQKMADWDPQADVRLALICPQCGHAWQAPLDIASFLWTEVRAFAGRLLRDVHVLASAYGWSEGEILSLSPWRRQAYLAMVDQ